MFRIPSAPVPVRTFILAVGRDAARHDVRKNHVHSMSRWFFPPAKSRVSGYNSIEVSQFLKPKYQDMRKSVLFVCMGNICRSAAAEAVMSRFAEASGVEVEVDSAGTHGYHIGNPADPRMIAAGEARGYQVTSRARQVTRADVVPGRFDLVLAMDSENYAALGSLASPERSHVRMFSDYLDESWPRDVPDPYYGEVEGFDRVLDMLEAGCPVILETLLGNASCER